MHVLRQARNQILWNYGFMIICFHIKTCLVATYKCTLAEILTISQLLSNACTQTGKKPNSVEFLFHDNLFLHKNMHCGCIQMFSCRNINYLPIIIKCMYSFVHHALCLTIMIIHGAEIEVFQISLPVNILHTAMASVVCIRSWRNILCISHLWIGIRLPILHPLLIKLVRLWVCRWHHAHFHVWEVSAEMRVWPSDCHHIHWWGRWVTHHTEKHGHKN